MASRKKNSMTNNNPYCTKCKGACWQGVDNNARTQTLAKEMFGIIPNNCVNGEGGVIHCPYSNE